MSQDSHSRNVCIFADEEVDRSPTGSGVMGRLALLHAKEKLDMNAPFVIESIIGSKFEGKILDRVTYGGFQAIIPQVTGSAYIIGENTFYMDPDDPYRHGFFLH